MRLIVSLRWRPSAHVAFISGAHHFQSRRLSHHQISELDHSIRQILVKAGPSPLPLITRQLPDVMREHLSEIDGGLLEYLKGRKQVYLIRKLPDGKNIISFTAEVAATTIKVGTDTKVKKAVVAVMDYLKSHPYAHVVDGVPVNEIEKHVTPAVRKVMEYHSGHVLAFLMSFPDVFRVFPEAARVKLVDESTPLPSGVAVMPVTAATQQGAVTTAPTRSPSTTQRSTPPPQRVGSAPVVGLSPAAEQLIATLFRCVPMSYFISLDTLLTQSSIARNEIASACAAFHTTEESAKENHAATAPGATSDGVVVAKALIALLEDPRHASLMSRVVDCRLFCDEETFDASRCFLRRIGTAALINAVVTGSGGPLLTESSAEGDCLFAALRPTQHAGILVDAMCWWLKEKRGGFDACQAWLREFEEALKPLVEGHDALSGGGPAGAAVSRAVARLKPPFVALADFHEAIAAHVASKVIGSQEAPAPRSITEDVVAVMLACVCMPHLFDVNADQYEVAIRPEIFASWLRLQTAPTATAFVPTADANKPPEEEANLPAMTSSSLQDGARSSRCTLLDVLVHATISNPVLAAYSRHLMQMEAGAASDAQAPILTICPNLYLRWLSELAASEKPTRLNLGATQQEAKEKPTWPWLLSSSGSDAAHIELRDKFLGEEHRSPLPLQPQKIHHVLLLVALFAPNELLVCDRDGLALSQAALQDLINSTPCATQPDHVRQDDHVATCEVFIWTPEMVLRVRKALMSKQRRMTSDEIDAGGANYSGGDGDRPVVYGSKSWSRQVVAEAILDSLPPLSDEEEGALACDVVLWQSHLKRLRTEYSDIIPPAVLDMYCTRNSLQFFQQFPSMFEVYELCVTCLSCFVIGRRGAKPPIGCHPKRCTSHDAAVRQLAILTVGGLGEERAMSCLSQEARVIIRKHGGAVKVASSFPHLFEVRSGIISYIGGTASKKLQQ